MFTASTVSAALILFAVALIALNVQAMYFARTPQLPRAERAVPVWAQVAQCFGEVVAHPAPAKPLTAPALWLALPTQPTATIARAVPAVCSYALLAQAITG